MQAFQLIPYPASDLPQIEIAGEIKRIEDSLSIRYAVTGGIESILLPTPLATASRKHDLWKATCFEFFIAVKDQPRYWEFNMSPSGDWNVYVMDAYRQVNMREEMLVEQIQFQVQKEAGGIAASVNVDLNPLFEENQILEVGITAVIQTKDGNESFWALAHPGKQADFHLRESLTIRL